MPLTDDEVINQLKQHWKTDSLTFEAEFHIPKNETGSLKRFKGGYFNQFTVPGKKNHLRYPTAARDAGSAGKSVNFRYLEGDNYKDGRRYQVRVIPEDAAKRRHNPFQLKILSIEEIVPGISFFGEYHRCKGDRMCFYDLTYKESGAILVNERGFRASASVHTGQRTGLKENTFYEFRARLCYDHQKRLQVIVELDTIIICDANPYEKIVDFCYDRMDNPIANSMLANMMREVGKGLYSSKQRMIFELLQNADDTPAGDRLVFNIAIIGDYLTIYHNGLPFSADDVKSITSAAQSTKRSDAAKTGYKGIGFKSVFTDSDEVLVRSGGFRFVFRRSHRAFSDFEEFYFNREKYRKFAGLKEDELVKFSQQREFFNPRNDVPWQMIPHWETSIPSVIAKDGRSGIYSNVFFALNFGSAVAEEYLEAINVFAAKPHFMLFLRNISEFHAGQDLEVKKDGEGQVTITRSSHGKVKSISYLKRRFTAITISDEAFAAERIYLFKKQEKNRYNISTYYFADAKGKAVETIPPKLAEFDETVLTLAVPVIDGSLQAEPDYLSGAESSCIYTYLPMNEARIRLPFLVNADFVPSSDREELQGDNPWNTFILAKTAHCHVTWLEELAILASQDINANKRYLSLVLKELLAGDYSVIGLIEKYNEVYLSRIANAAFILSDENAVIRPQAAILDQTGISGYNGGALFYQLTKERRRLPHPELESGYLSPAYLKIATFTENELFEVLAGADSVAVLSEFISHAEKETYLEFIGWLNTFLSRVGKALSALPMLPIFRIADQVLTFSQALAQPALLIKLRKLEAVEGVLMRAGLELSAFFLDDYPALFAEFQNGDHYLAKNESLFERIAGGARLTVLSPADKNTLLGFVSSLSGIGEKKFAGELKLFCAAGRPEIGRALNEMIVSAVVDAPSWMAGHLIQPVDEQGLEKKFQAYLVKTNEIFKKLLSDPGVFRAIATGLGQGGLSSFFAYLAAEASKAEKADREAFQTFACIASDSETLWKIPADVFFADSLVGVPLEKYSSIGKAAAALSGAVFPHPTTLAFIKAAELQCRSDLSITISAVIDVTVLRDFLGWLEDRTFFNRVCIKKAASGYSVNTDVDAVQYYNNDEALQDVIESAAEGKGMAPLPNELYFKGIEVLGLLAGTGLLDWMIKNGYAVPKLAVFISQARNGALALAYLDALQELELDNESEYRPKTPEHTILDILINQSGADDTYLKTFSEKITINGNNLAGYNVSDRIHFKFKDENNRTERQYELSLSSILPVYKNSARTVTSVLDHITEFKGKGVLREKVFSAEEKPLKDVASEIEGDAKEYLTTWQVFFLLLYQEKFPGKNVWREKDDFTVWFRDKDHAKYEKLCMELMGIFYEQNYDVFLSEYSFGGVLNDSLIMGSELTTSDEELPEWLNNWLETEPKQQKPALLVRAGLQGPASWVVLIRDALQNNKMLQFERSLAMLEDGGQLSRTLAWLADHQEALKLSLTAEFLKPLYKKCHLLAMKKQDFPIPVMTSATSKVYSLRNHILTGDVHLKNSGWEGYEKEVFAYVRGIKGEVIDDLMPEVYITTFAQFTEIVTLQPDAELLRTNSLALRVDFYQEWPEKATWPVWVYRGEILPGQAVYCKNVVKNTIYGDVADCAGACYIRRYSDQHELLFLLRQVLPEGAMNSLRRFKEEYDERKRREQDEANYSDEELAALNQMFSNKVPRSFFKDLNLAALIKGLFYLKDEGYDVSGAEANLPSTHPFSNLSPVYPPGTEAVPINALTVSCRSAKGGLLFLTAKAWKNLALPNVKLYVLEGRNYSDNHFYLNRDEIVSDKEADFQLMRIRSGKMATAIDNMLNGNADPDDLQLVIRIRKSDRYDSVFEDVYRKQQSDTVRGARTDGEDLY